MALALVLAAAATPILSCPGGTIEATCTAADVAAKIALTRARVANIAQRCLYDFGGKCSVEASGRINTADRSEEHTSELQSLMRTSYAVFGLKKKIRQKKKDINKQKTIAKHIKNRAH